MSRLTKAMRERFEFGEIEREAANTRRFHRAGGWLDRMLAWAERKASGGRQEADERVREEDEARRAALAAHRQENERG